jgi:5-methylcytosine-specific restriction endonuclease McrA
MAQTQTLVNGHTSRTTLPRNVESKRFIEKWVRNARRKGDDLDHIKDNLYDYDGNIVLIKYRKAQGPRIGFSVLKHQLKDIDYFIFLCRTDPVEASYTIPVGFVARRSTFNRRNRFPGQTTIAINAAQNELNGASIRRYLTKSITNAKSVLRHATPPSNKIDNQKRLPDDDYSKPPKKFRSSVLRYIRDTRKAGSLKRYYENTCQVCKLQMKYRRGLYSEVHHVRPLSRKGRDVKANMLVLCPTHHARFDFATLVVSPSDSVTLYNEQGKVEGKLQVSKHDLDPDNLRFQLKRMKQIYGTALHLT